MYRLRHFIDYKYHNKCWCIVRESWQLSQRGLCCGPRGPLAATTVPVVLGIETSCDDTGVAVVSADGRILGEALHSQHLFHLALGGITPPFARDLHEEKISNVFELALEASKLKFSDLNAVATTVMPGLPLSLEVGLNFTKSLLKKHNIPFIPIHHMEAHALTVRMVQKVEFPYLVLLISGGHCLLAVANSVDEFFLLGNSEDDAPGEAFDKVARRMKLRNLPQCSEMNGGQAIEFLARKGDPTMYEFANPMWKHSNCQFSFAGLKNKAFRYIWDEEKTHGVIGDEVIPNVADLCASFQNAISKHLFRKVNRGMAFCERQNLFPGNKKKTLVVSGGVACNKYIRSAMEYLCELTDYELICPPPKLCTDNGVMIAWNGMEKFKAGIGIVDDYESVRHVGSCPFGKSLIEEVTNSGIKGVRLKYNTCKIAEKLTQHYQKESS